MSDCLFCKIVNGDIPAHKIYEDDDTLAFLDIAPINPGHTLVIPKEHYANMEEIPEDLLAQVMKTVKKVGHSLKERMSVPGYNLTENNDPVAGQIIPHIHFHVIPRKGDDGLQLWAQGQYQSKEAEEVANKLKIKN